MAATAAIRLPDVSRPASGRPAATARLSGDRQRLNVAGTDVVLGMPRVVGSLHPQPETGTGTVPENLPSRAATSAETGLVSKRAKMPERDVKPRGGRF